jgi:hypothetical protein
MPATIIRTCNCLASAPFTGVDRKWLAEGQTDANDPTETLAFSSTGAQQHGFSALRPHEAMGMLRTQDVMVQISYPLPAGDRHI